TLPEPLAAYAIEAAASLGCDPAFLALPLLAVTGSAIGNTRVIRLKRGWEEPSVFWSALVSDSGTLKSPAQSRAVGRLYRIQKRLFEEYKEKLAAYQNELQEYTTKKLQAKKNGDDPGPAPDKPVQRRIVCSDITIEKLAEVLEANPRGLLVARDELS